VDVTDDLSELAAALRIRLDAYGVRLACLPMVAFAPDEREAAERRSYAASLN